MNLDFSKCRTVPVYQDDGSVAAMPPPPHVRAGVAWLAGRPYGMNGNDMGGMKSATAIIAAQFMFEAGMIDRAILVAPAPVRSSVWYDPEIGELALHLRDDLPSQVSEFHRKIRKWTRGDQSAPRIFKWIVTNYEWLRGRGDKVATLQQYCGPRTVLILDESSSVRSFDSAQTQAILRLRWAEGRRGSLAIGQPRCGYAWLLNGTPLAEGPEDLFAQGLVMHPLIHGCRYITHFRNRYAIMEGVRGSGGQAILDKRGKPVMHVAGWQHLEELQAAFAPHVLRQDWRRDFPLPGVLPTQTIEVAMSADEWAAYRDMRDDMVHWLADGNVGVARHAAVKVMRLAQITSGLLGGLEGDVEAPALDNAELLASLGLESNKIDLPGSFLDGVELEPSGLDALLAQRAHLFAPRDIAEIGRSKLDALLDLQAHLLREDPNTKLLIWFKFVPELRRWHAAAGERFPGLALGSVCGEPISGRPVREERASAMRLLHPRTAPPGPAAVGGTYGTGGLGLNFTAFSTVVHCSHVYEDWKRRQAEKRVDRPGQRNVVTQFDLMATGPRGQRTIDHVILEARRKKQDLNDWTVAAWIRALKEE